ncbi:trans-sialidase, putative, partial [Trypanosoma cruzi marinkellei]
MSCSLRGCFALLPANVSDVLLLLLFSPFLEHKHARKESKQTRIATVKFEGSERSNSTHTPSTHTYLYAPTCCCSEGTRRTHNRRRVTGSSGRRREGRESERQRPNMSRRVFTSAVLLPLLIVMMCCGICGATPAIEEVGKNDLINIQKLQSVNLFVPQKT